MFDVPVVYSTVQVVARTSSSPRINTSRPSYTPRPSTSTQRNNSNRSSQNRVSRAETPKKQSTFNGRTYNRAGNMYTNSAGIWVFYWLMYTNEQNKQELRCFDKDHKRTTCNSDKNTHKKEWYN